MIVFVIIVLCPASPCGCVSEVVCSSLRCAGVMWVGVLLCVGVVGVGDAGDLPLNLPSFEGGGGSCESIAMCVLSFLP